jgi:hypothetical protein
MEEIRGDKDQIKRFEQELRGYLSFAQEQMEKYDMGDVMVTDHEPRTRKVFTLNQSEDNKLFAYH